MYVFFITSAKVTMHILNYAVYKKLWTV